MTPEVLLLLVLGSAAALGYVLAHLWPLPVLQAHLAGRIPGEDLRDAVRRVLRAPSDATDCDLTTGLYEMRDEAQRRSVRP